VGRRFITCASGTQSEKQQEQNNWSQFTLHYLSFGELYNIPKQLSGVAVLNEHISEQTNVFCTIEHVSISHPDEKSNRYPTTKTAITGTTTLANGIVTPHGPRNPESHLGPGGIARRGTTKSDRLHSVFTPVLPSQSQEAILLLARRLHINGRPEWDASLSLLLSLPPSLPPIVLSNIRKKREYTLPSLSLLVTNSYDHQGPVATCTFYNSKPIKN
jgi:hypothetical protein